jgi:hypothetical protein
MNKIKITLFIILFVPAITFGQKKSSIHYNSFTEFYSFISNKHTLNFTNLHLSDSSFSVRNIGTDTIEETVSFKLDDLKLKFVCTKDTFFYPTYFDSAYILLNDKK